MDFTLSPELEKLRLKTRDFIASEVLPLETRPEIYDEFENISLDRLDELRAKAKAAGLWAPQMPKERGGLGLSVVGWAVIYEEANRSIFGPAALNCAAPDDGNMTVLNKVLSEAEKDKWLQPIIDGKLRSSFVMTEPAPGSGSDPGGMMLTKAEKKGDRYVIRGRKWFISGAALARHFILIARTSDDPRRGLSAFLYHGDDPGWRIVRRIDIMGPQEHGGVCELDFDGLEIPRRAALARRRRWTCKLTQLRLGPARLTHCMRWLGLAKRCLEIAQAHVGERRAFGAKLADRESVQMMLGDVAKDIEVGRLLTMNAAWRLDQGDKAQSAVSMAKIHVADTLHKAADAAIQLLGAKGYSKDTVLDWIYRYARAARLIDGASEVHRMLIARGLAKDGIDFWKWG